MSCATVGLAIVTLLGACVPVPQTEYEADMDRDGDGVLWPDDCAPDDRLVGEIGTVTLYPDGDHDTYGDDGAPTTPTSCADARVAPEGWAKVGGDCNDEDAAINPEAEDVCDGIDNNCDGNAADADTTCQEAGLVPITTDHRALRGDDGAMAGSAMATLLDEGGAPGALAVSAPSTDASSPRVYVVELYDGDQSPLWQDELVLGGTEANAGVSTTEESTRLGHALKAADLDGEGRQELLIGAPGWEADSQAHSGAVWLLGDGAVPEDGGNIRSAAQAYLHGPERSLLGYTIGSLSCDDTSDCAHLLALGAPGLSLDTTTPDSGGVVLVPNEALGDLAGEHDLASVQDATTLLASDPLVHAGAAVSDGGDLTGDGVGDLLVGAASSRGGAWLLDGAELSNGMALEDGLVSYVVDSNADELGAALLISPDLNGDGVDDAVIGAPGATVSGSGYGGVRAGAVYVVAGGPALAGSADLEERALVVFFGDGEDARLGAALAAPGDLDGDAARDTSDPEGRSDLAMGAPGGDGSGLGSGAVYIGYGPLSHGRVNVRDDLPELTGQTPGDALGTALAGAPDLTCEGNVDLLVGAPWAGLGSGAVYLYGSGLPDTTRRGACAE